MTSLSAAAMDYIVSQVNEAKAKELVALFNSIRPQTVADTAMACAQIMGAVLAECPEDVRHDFWRAFEKLAHSSMALHQRLDS